MIRYTPQKELSFEKFASEFGQDLDPENRWVKLADRLPWDEMANIYGKRLSAKMGRPSLDGRLVIGAFIAKHWLGLSDRDTIAMIQENIYLQYFVGYRCFHSSAGFDPSLFVTLRERMGADQFDQFNVLIIAKAKGIAKPAPASENDSQDDSQDASSSEESPSGKNEPKPKGKGKLKLDATVADQMIEYPTDLKLLNQGRLESERLIDWLYKRSDRTVKPRTYRRLARSRFLALAKQRRKGHKVIRKGIGQQLRYLRRNIQTIHTLLEELPSQPFPLRYRDLKLFWVIQLLYDQQTYMYDHRVRSHPDRIVSIYQPYVRPIPRGKDKGKTEFGAKLGVSECDGFCRLDHISWNAYNECKDLMDQVKAYRSFHGYDPEVVLIDRIYLTKENRAWLKSKGIRHIGQPLGRPKPMSPYFKGKLRKERKMRNHIEGKFGQGKNAYGLSRIRARRIDTSESWIAAIFLVMNLVRWIKIQPQHIGPFFTLIYQWIQQEISKVRQTRQIQPLIAKGWYEKGMLG